MFTLTSSDLSSNKVQLTNGFIILKAQKNVSDYIKNNDILSFFLYVSDLTQCHFGGAYVAEICDYFLEHEFHKEIIKLAEYLNTVCEKIDGGYYGLEGKFFFYSMQLLNFFTLYSRNFRLKVHDAGGLKPLIGFMKNDTFLKNNSTKRGFRFLLLNFGILTIEIESYKTYWSELNSVTIFLNVLKTYNSFKKDICGIILNVANDDQIGFIAEMPEIISIFTRALARGANLIETSGSLLNRQKRDIYDEDEQISKHYDICCVPYEDDNNITESLIGILRTIYRVSVNNKIKYDLFVKFNVKDPLKIIILKGNQIESSHALKLLGQLTFDPQVLEIVSSDTELIKFVEKTSTDPHVQIKATIRACKQILWLINQTKKKTEQIKTSYSNSQVMISYNSASRDLCIKITNKLKEAGFKVWIDINEIHGSSLESMAHAIESSEFIIMCITEKYRQSLNCQAEAQYAFKLKKNIIPLIFEKGYENVRFLNFLLYFVAKF